MSVCLLVTAVSPTEMDEPIKMRLGIWTQMGQMNCVFCGGPGHPGEVANFFGGGSDAAIAVSAAATCSSSSATADYLRVYR